MFATQKSKKYFEFKIKMPQIVMCKQTNIDCMKRELRCLRK